MTESKGVNRLYFIIVVLFVAASLIMGRVIPIKLPVYASVLISQAVVLVPALLYCRIRKISIKELIPCRKISFSTGVLVVVTTYLMYPLMIVLNAVTLLFTNSGTASMQNEMANFSLIISTLLIAVIPACVEEFVFRGVLFQTYRKKRVFSAIMLSAFLFGCTHMNLNQFAYATVLGIYLAFLVEGTGSILSSILAHFTLNFTGVLLTRVLKLVSGNQMVSGMQQTGKFVQYGDEFTIMMIFGILIWFVIAIGTTTGAIAIYVYICKKNGRLEQVKAVFRKKTDERMITIPLILAVAVTVVIMVKCF